MMRKVAVNHPRAGIFRFELDHPACATPTRTVFMDTSSIPAQRPPFRSSHHKLMAVQMNRVMIHSKIYDAQPHPATQLAISGVVSGAVTPLNVSQLYSMAAVFGTEIPRQHRPLLQNQPVVVFCVRFVRVLRCAIKNPSCPIISCIALCA